MRPIAVNDSGIRSFHLDFDEDEFKRIVIDNVMFDAQLAGICLSRDERIAHELASGVDEQLASGHWHHDVVHLMPVPASMTARGEAPFGDDASIVVGLDGGDGRRPVIGWSWSRHGMPRVLRRIGCTRTIVRR